MKTKLIIDTEREGYGTDQVRRTMTVGELIAALEQYDEDIPVFLGFDRRYTYGGITEACFEEVEADEDGEDDE